MKISIKDCFNEKGNLIFDPYRHDPDTATPRIQALYDYLFDESGYLTNREELAKFVDRNPNLPWRCDAVGLYHAEMLAMQTKGSYPTYYYYR